MWVGISPSSTICCTVKSCALVGAIALAFTLASGVGPAVSCKEAADVGAVVEPRGALTLRFVLVNMSFKRSFTHI